MFKNSFTNSQRWGLTNKTSFKKPAIACSGAEIFFSKLSMYKEIGTSADKYNYIVGTLLDMMCDYFAINIMHD